MDSYNQCNSKDEKRVVLHKEGGVHSLKMIKYPVS